jgi:hypothetical protein
MILTKTFFSLFNNLSFLPIFTESDFVTSHFSHFTLVSTNVTVIQHFSPFCILGYYFENALLFKQKPPYAEKLPLRVEASELQPRFIPV